jgi:hypothetical protein
LAEGDLGGNFTNIPGDRRYNDRGQDRDGFGAGKDEYRTGFLGIGLESPDLPLGGDGYHDWSVIKSAALASAHSSSSSVWGIFR